MKNRRVTAGRPRARGELAELRRRLDEAEETLRAIREGEVDAIVMSGKGGERVFSLAGADQVYRLIVQTMKEAALTVALDGTILLCNAQFGHFLGLPNEKILGHDLQEFVAPEQADSIPGLIAHSAAGPVKQRLVFQSQGQPAVPAHISANVLNQPDGTSICIVATDLTELEASTEMLQQLRRQQEALLESESRLRAVFAVSPDAIIITDDDGRFVEANPAAAALFGFQDQKELIGIGLLDCSLPGHDLDQFWAALRSCGCYQGEHHLVRRDSTALLVEIFAVANIRPARHLAVLRDITDRRRAEDALRKAHSQLELSVQERTAELAAAVSDLQRAEAGLRRTNLGLRMLSSCNEAIVRIDDEDKLTQEVCRIAVEVGCYPYAWVGLAEYDENKTIRPVACKGFPAGYLESAPFTWAETDRGREPTAIAIRSGQVQFGRDFLHEPHLSPWRESALRLGFRSCIALPLRAGNDFFGALSIYATREYAFDDAEVHILTELSEDLALGMAALRTRKALRESRDLLRALASELTLTERRERQRLAKILHDHVQQLLVGAKFRLATLDRVPSDTLAKQARGIEQLLDECIGVSRTLTAELSPPVLQEGDLVASLEWLADWMSDKHGLSVRLRTETKPGPVPNDVKLLLFESARELLFNVVKHARTDSALLTLRRVNRHHLQVVVSDKGAGFNAARLGKSRLPGSGFGLLSIRERMALIGGRLEIVSREGKGSCFILTVPLATPTEPA
ncbi:MAG: PAS domain S-box protein [Acidobacteriota bacterium]